MFLLNYKKYWIENKVICFDFNKTFKKLSLIFYSLNTIVLINAKWQPNKNQHKFFFLTVFNKKLSLHNLPFSITFNEYNKPVFKRFNLKYNIIQTLKSLYLYTFNYYTKLKNLIVLPLIADQINFRSNEDLIYYKVSPFDCVDIFNAEPNEKNNFFFPVSFLKVKDIFHKFVYLPKMKKNKGVKFQQPAKAVAKLKTPTSLIMNVSILKINFFNNTLICTNSFQKHILSSVVLVTRIPNFFGIESDLRYYRINLVLGKLISSGFTFFKKQYINCLIVKCLSNKFTLNFFLNTFRGFSFMFLDKYKIIKSSHVIKPFLFFESGLVIEIFKRLNTVKIFGVLKVKLFDNIKIILPFHNSKQFIIGVVIYTNDIGLTYAYVPLFFDLIYRGVVVTLCDSGFTKYIISSFRRAAIKNLNFFFYKNLIVPKEYKHLYVHFNKFRKL